MLVACMALFVVSSASAQTTTKDKGGKQKAVKEKKKTKKKAATGQAVTPPNIGAASDTGLLAVDNPTAPGSASPAVMMKASQMPKPDYDLDEYLAKNVHYPDSARKYKVTGSVVVKFLVFEDGSIKNAEVENGIGAGCDEEAKRVIAAMPAWKPGMNNGQPVKVLMKQPVAFKLK